MKKTKNEEKKYQFNSYTDEYTTLFVPYFLDEARGENITEQFYIELGKYMREQHKTIRTTIFGRAEELIKNTPLKQNLASEENQKQFVKQSKIFARTFMDSQKPEAKIQHYFPIGYVRFKYKKE